ncbi:copper transport protein CCH-like [Hordeum vulgare]|nr:copper transport protein CCH-like [Hordeum vulgare]
MATEPLQCKTLVLRVSIHCEGCKKKVKKVLQGIDGVLSPLSSPVYLQHLHSLFTSPSILLAPVKGDFLSFQRFASSEGVYRCDIDARSNKVTVAVTGNVSADALLKRLRRSGKLAQPWPEQQQQPAGGSHRPGETKNGAIQPDKPGDTGTAHKPASDDAETNAADQSNSKATPEEDPNKVARETAKPAQDDTESTNADADGDDAVSHRSKEPTAEQCNGSERKRKQLRQEEEKSVDAIATVVVVAAAPDQGSNTCHSPPHLQQQQPPPVHVLSYSMARPSASAAYYAAAPAPAAPGARSLPPQNLPYTYPPCCYHPQPWSLAPQTGAASPARYSYGDLFSDDNANSCSVM